MMFCGFVSSIRDTPAQLVHVDQTPFATILLKEDSQISLTHSHTLSLTLPPPFPTFLLATFWKKRFPVVMT